MEPHQQEVELPPVAAFSHQAPGRGLTTAPSLGYDIDGMEGPMAPAGGDVRALPGIPKLPMAAPAWVEGAGAPAGTPRLAGPAPFIPPTEGGAGFNGIGWGVAPQLWKGHASHQGIHIPPPLCLPVQLAFLTPICQILTTPVFPELQSSPLTPLLLPHALH